MNKLVRPGGTIGILGGGQLARMMALAAHRMGYRAVVLDPDPRCPAARVAEVVVGNLHDVDAASSLAARVDVVTIDTEHVPAAVLERIEPILPMHPSAAVLGIIQDRLSQKTWLTERGFPVADFEPASETAMLHSACAALGLPAVLKARFSGYDGRGQAVIQREADIDAAWERIAHVPAVLERFVPFRAEISVIVARDCSGNKAFFPIAENVHQRHALHTTRVPARISERTRSTAEQLAARVVDAFELTGVTAVELFLLDDERLMINEIAPRVHNSGHFTLDACVTSQFEQHVRAICGLPLGDPGLLRPAVMLNLYGDLWSREGAPDWGAVLRHPEARLHLYGKLRARPRRKMGHVILLDPDLDRALARAENLLSELSPPGCLPSSEDSGPVARLSEVTTNKESVA